MVFRYLIVASVIAAGPLVSACAPLVVGGVAATGVSVAHDRRTTGSLIEDQSIKMRISSAFGNDQAIVDQTHINVTSFNGIVLLTGEAPTEPLRARAADIARKTEEVRRVHNEIQLAAPSSFMTRSSDSWITTKVKAALVGMDIEGFDPSRVKVVTENGTVYLLGMVYHREASAATEEARQVGGVQRIVKLFEYLD